MTEAWRIGVNIAMTSNAAQVLGVLGRDLFALGKQAEALTSKLEAVRLAAIGATGVVAGGVALDAMGKLVSHGEELVNQQALMRSAGMDNQEIAEATAKAWKTTSDVMGTGIAENMAAIRELRMVFGNTQEAMANLDTVEKARMVMENVRGTGAGDQVYDMAKALDINNASQDPKHFEALIDAMTKAAIASGGKVLGSDFFSAFKYGRTATLGWDDKFIGTILPTLIQEMKGNGGSGGGPGTALQSAFQAVVGGTMGNKAKDEFSALGLLDESKIIRTTTGHVEGIGPGGVTGSAEFQSNPYAWVQDVLVPALQKHGDDTPEKMREEISHMFSNRTAQQIITMMATQQGRFDRDAGLITGAKGLDAQQQLLNDSPAMKMKAFTEAWQNLMVALGAPLVETAYKMLDALTSVLQFLTKVAVAHPEAVKIIGELTAALAALAIALGTYAVGSAAIGALTGLTTGLAGLATVLGSVAVAVPAAVAALGLLVKAGSDAETPANRATIEQNRKDMGTKSPTNMEPQDGYGVDGRPIHPTSYVPPGGSAKPMVQAVTYLQLDGKTIAKAVSNHQANYATLPPSGTSNFDGYMSPSAPGQQIRV